MVVFLLQWIVSSGVIIFTYNGLRNIPVTRINSPHHEMEWIQMVILSYNIYEMLINEFSGLEYGDKLRLIVKSGKLHTSFALDKYQISLYKLNEFFVELKRESTKLCFDSITAIKYEDLPSDYK